MCPRNIVQGVPQYCINFCFLNFSASYRRRNSILDIFQQPILCRFWKYPIFYYSVKFGLRYWQNTAGRSFQKLIFFVYYSMKQFSIHELSWVLMSAHDCSWKEVRRSYELSWAWGHGEMSTFKISWSKFHRILNNWIFSKSTQKGLLKNVQDGISTPLGSQEI